MDRLASELLRAYVACGLLPTHLPIYLSIYLSIYLLYPPPSQSPNPSPTKKNSIVPISHPSHLLYPLSQTIDIRTQISVLDALYPKILHER